MRSYELWVGTEPLMRSGSLELIAERAEWVRSRGGEPRIEAVELVEVRRVLDLAGMAADVSLGAAL